MAIHRGEFERIRSVVVTADTDEPLTAREILTLLDERDEAFESAHEVATVLGRRAESDGVEVIRDRPYRYRFADRQT